MGNTYFQFKQFRIEQDRCAMKVATDAAILGAITPIPQNGAVLDIGTGTGILALMVAQRFTGAITAIDLDEESYHQAFENIAASPWPNRISVRHADIRTFHSKIKFDLIICNPPFYQNHLRSASERQNIARHADQLSYRELIDAVKSNLQQNGLFSVLLPVNTANKFISLSEISGLFVRQQVMVNDNVKQHPIRTITIFSLQKHDPMDTTLFTIKDDSGSYTKQFRELMSPYYLNL